MSTSLHQPPPHAVAERNTPPRRYLFGAHRRQLQDAIARLAVAGDDVLVETVRAAVRTLDLRTAMLARLVERDIRASLAERVAAVLQETDCWTVAERETVARWLHRCGWAGWREWALPLVPFPRPRTDPAFDGDLLALAREVRGLPVPAGLFLDDDAIARLGAHRRGVASPAETMGVALRGALARANDGSPVLLAGAAAAAGAWNTVARLFDEGYLDDHVFDDGVIAAYHCLDWTRFGDVKARFAGRLATPEPTLCFTPDLKRFRAHQLWRKGLVAEAVATLESLLDTAAFDAPTAFEYLLVHATGDQRRLRRAPELIEQLRSQDDPPGDLPWLELLSRRSSHATRDVVATLERGVAPSLPPTTSPLFGPVVAHLEWRLAAERRREALACLEAELARLDPLWREQLPFPERPYLEALLAVREAGTDAPRLATLLRRLLLLPIRTRWVLVALGELLSEHRGSLLSGDDGLPSPLGMLVIDICSRTVEHLLETGLEFRSRDEIELCSGDPVRAAAALYRLLEEHAA